MPNHPSDTITLATPSVAQLDAVRALVTGAGLPAGGLADHFPGGYVVADRGGAVVGVAGLEVHGASGLLRSVAVDPVLRGTGLGVALSADRIAAAHALGLEAVYLLTTTAADFFVRLGFRPCRRDEAPEALARSPELASICPSSAACLRLGLQPAPTRAV